MLLDNCCYSSCDECITITDNIVRQRGQQLDRVRSGCVCCCWHALLSLLLLLLCIALSSPHWLYDLQHTLEKLINMHFLPQLSDFVPLKNGFYSFLAQTD